MGGTERRVGVVGVGMMGADHADRLVRRIAGARLVAVSDADQPRPYKERSVVLPALTNFVPILTKSL